MSFLFNNCVDFLAHGKDSSVHHTNRDRSQRSLYSGGKASKIFPVNLLIQASDLTFASQHENVFNRFKIWSSCKNGKFSTPSQPDLGFTLFCEGPPFYRTNFRLGLALYLNMLAKCSEANQEKLFSILSSMILFRSNFILFICYCFHKVRNIFSCAFVTSFSSKIEIKS